MTTHPPERHAIPIRHPSFEFGEDIPRHWAGGNPIATHVFNALNLLFPDGERFFIQAVNDHVSELDDPELRRQARAFAGQEAVHGREHERYFERLRAQGYRIDRFLRVFQTAQRIVSRFPRSWRLAITAGAEHYTATLGHFALTATHVRDFDPTMERLVVWHATEEVEHKAVAFDVMRAAGIGYPTRIGGYLFATLVIGGFTAVGARMLIRQDRLGRSELREARRQLRERERGGDREAVAFVARQVRAYFRPGFHPSEVDDLELAHERLAETGLESQAA